MSGSRAGPSARPRCLRGRRPARARPSSFATRIRKRFGGKGVERAVANVEGEIAPALVGEEAIDQARIDGRLRELDGTANKSRLGANAILAVSLATARAAAAAREQWLYEHLGALAGHPPPRMPVPMMNVVNGGAHADNNVDVQEFMVVPCGVASFREAVRCGAEVFHALRSLLLARGLATAVGDEGGVAPDLDSNREALELILAAVGRAGYRPGEDVFIAIDAASSEFHRDGIYHFEGGTLDASGFASVLAAWADDFPIVSIEGRHGGGRLGGLGEPHRPASGTGCSSSVTISS